MKNTIILHGCPGSEEKAMDPEQRTYDKHWIPWTKKQLEEKGYKVKVPLMPEPWKPNYEAWKKEFDKLEVNKETILIGHSCGSAFLVRWLGETKKEIYSLALVAPWKIPYREDGSDKEFYNYDIDKTIKERIGHTVIFTADNEEEDGKTSAKIFHEALGGTLISMTGKGHYCIRDMKTEAFQELIIQATTKPVNLEEHDTRKSN